MDYSTPQCKMADISRRRVGMITGQPWSIVMVILYGCAGLSLFEDMQRSPIINSKRKNCNLRYRKNFIPHEPYIDLKRIEKENKENEILDVNISSTSTVTVPKVVPATPQDQKKTSKFLNRCDADDLNLLAFQLPRNDCDDSRLHPWSHRCSFSYATRCPDKSQWWSPAIRSEIVNSVFIGGGQGSDLGLSAVGLLRLATGDDKYSTEAWQKEAFSGVTEAPKCPTHSSSYNNNSTRITSKRPRTTVHYFATNAETAKTLQQASKKLHWDQNFRVNRFPYFTPDTLDRMFSMTRRQPVDMLRIDGQNDVYAILNSGRYRFLPKTRYLEFENNWLEGWTKHTLSETIQLLDDEGFLCYWAGTNGNLWRITNCWQDHYDNKFWSNVACVSRSHDDLVETMETMFQNTIRKGHNITNSDEKSFGTDGSQSAWKAIE